VARLRLSGHTATRLADGRILVAGAPARRAPLASALLYDPATDSFSKAGDLAAARTLHTSTLLLDGRVLIAGGWDGQAGLASMEIFDPASGSFSLFAAALPAARYGHGAASRVDGTVLISGGAQTAARSASIPPPVRLRPRQPKGCRGSPATSPITTPAKRCACRAAICGARDRHAGLRRGSAPARAYVQMVVADGQAPSTTAPTSSSRTIWAPRSA